MLSLLAERKVDAFVPGIKNIIEGGYELKDGTKALSDCREDSKKARKRLLPWPTYRTAKKEGDEAAAKEAYTTFAGKCALFWLWLY